MDRIDPAVTTSVAPQPTSAAATSGLGHTFRALAQGTSTERRRRSLQGTVRTGRGVPPAATDDSGSWRLAL